MTRRCEPDQLPGIPAGDPGSHDMIAAGPEPMPGSWHTLFSGQVTPQWMRADLARLEAAFPAFSFAIRRGLRGFTFEAWRDPAEGGLYAVITDDPREMWRELETAGR